MTGFGENTISPLEIQDARQAAHATSELQRGVEDRLRDQSKAVAEAERAYRKALATEILRLRAEKVAVTACADIARGEPKIADLRYARDVAEGVYEATKQEAFRRGADRKTVEALIAWSQARDLRTYAPPADGSVSVIGGRRAA